MFDLFSLALAGIIIILSTLLYRKYYGQVVDNNYRSKETVGATVLKEICDIPGYELTDAETGNSKEMVEAGGIIEFIIKSHEKYGDIFKFYLGNKLHLSIASPELFKHHVSFFNRAIEIFLPYLPLLGESTVQICNDEEGRRRRKLHDRAFSHAVVIERIPLFQEVAGELAGDWSTSAEKNEPIPLSVGLYTGVVKVLTRFAFGDFFKNQNELEEFKNNYHNCLEALTESITTGPMTPEHKNYAAFKTALDGLKSTMNAMIKSREESEIAPEDKLFIDNLLDNYDNSDMIFADGITYLIGGTHTTSYYMVWTIYYLCGNPCIEDKMIQEIWSVFGGPDEELREPMNMVTLNKLTYMQQVLNESLRLSDVGPLATRYHDTDSPLGDYNVPKGTPVIHALVAIFKNPRIYPDPYKFDPERFGPSSTLSSLAFAPFGFSGGRKCPGYRLAMVEAQVFLVTLLRKFKVKMIPGQKVVPMRGVTCYPVEEIMVKIERR